MLLKSVTTCDNKIFSYYQTCYRLHVHAIATRGKPIVISYVAVVHCLKSVLLFAGQKESWLTWIGSTILEAVLESMYIYKTIYLVVSWFSQVTINRFFALL